MTLRGHYEGTVVSNRDPDQLLRVRVDVPELGITTGWARVGTPAGGLSERGDAAPLGEGAGVILVFLGGSPDRPFVTNCFWSNPGGASEVPRAARGSQEPRAAALKGIGIVTLPDGRGEVREPANPYGATYPNNRVMKSGGWMIELDSTPGHERVHIYHVSGTYIEVHPDGTLVQRTVARRGKDGEPVVGGGSEFKVVEGTKTEQVGVHRNAHVLGSDRVLVEGERIDEVQGDVTRIVGGEEIVEVTGDRLVSSGGNHELVAVLRMILNAPEVMLGRGLGQAGVVTTATHPFDFFTGLPIRGSKSVRADL